ncbi:MAG: hypothetical protein K2F73_00110 [Ruminococcus sp.]|nr:hypothetical protein [Ruminococcus sp.]
MSRIRTAGADLRKIANKTYAKYTTEKGEKIVLALEKCRIPYFAKFNSTEISLTYDADYKENVEEIIRKLLSGVYDEIMAELKRMSDKNVYKPLLPEIAETLGTSVSFLKSRPDEVQEIICKRYVNLWYCDTPTIKRELEELINLGNPEEHYVSAEIQRKRAEKICQTQIQKENRECPERERRF